jgi:drug/metabolite transporter (DMT)-like permease
MDNKSDFRRRLAGGVFLGIAVLMLAAGETVLRERLGQSPALTVVYWMSCFIAVILAIMIALLDLWIVRRRSREEARGLVKQTLDEIAREKAQRKSTADGDSHRP